MKKALVTFYIMFLIAIFLVAFKAFGLINFVDEDYFEFLIAILLVTPALVVPILLNILHS